MKKFNYDNMKVVEIFKDNLTFEEQVERVEKVNEIFVDIAVNYHVDKIKENKNKEQQKA